MLLTPLVSESSLGPLFMAAGIGLLIAMLLRRSSKRFSKRGGKKAPPVRSGMTNPEPVKPSVTSQADRREVEFHELARDMMGQLDSKMILLQELVAKSQRQIDRMEELLDDSSAKQPVETESGG